MKDAKAKLQAAREAYHEAREHAPPHIERSLHHAVKTAMAEFAAKMVEGAEPCPKCGAMPHGIEQPRRDGRGCEYEIGCLACKGERVRGGLMPSHAVEAWNAGVRN